MSRLAVIEHGDLTKRCAQIAIVVNQNVRQSMDCRSKIVQGSRETGQQLVVGNVVTALRHAHGDALCRLLGTGESDVTQDHHVPGSMRVFKKSDLVAYRIGKDGLEDKALTRLQQR